MKVFADTGAWIALLVSSDRHHDHARTTFSTLLAENTLIVISNYIVDETVTWLRYHAGHKAAVDFRKTIEKARDSKRLYLEWVSERIECQAWEIFVKYTDLELSLTDCTSAVIACDLGLLIWTYDRHFEALGLRLVT